MRKGNSDWLLGSLVGELTVAYRLRLLLPVNDVRVVLHHEHRVGCFDDIGHDLEFIKAPEDSRPHEVLLIVLHLEVTFVAATCQECRYERKHGMTQFMQADHTPILLTELLLHEHETVLPFQVFRVTLFEGSRQYLMEHVPMAEGEVGAFIGIVVLVEHAVDVGKEISVQVFLRVGVHDVHTFANSHL